jgi:HTH-type transcriptional regulator/antitoxin HigA
MVMITTDEYEKLVAFLDYLIDEIGEDESHPLASVMDEVGLLIELYENRFMSELD